MEKLNVSGGGARGESFLCMSGENGSLLYSSQRDLGVGRGLVSSAQRGAFLSGLPRGGAPVAQDHGGMERRLAIPGKRTCAGSMKPSGRTEERPQKKIFAILFSAWTEEGEDAGSHLVTKSKAGAGEQKL